MRLSIEITSEQHQRLKAVAALSGKSLKDYVLERALPPFSGREGLSEEEALHRLEMFLKPRLEAAECGNVTNRSVTEIFDEVRREFNH